MQRSRSLNRCALGQNKKGVYRLTHRYTPFRLAEREVSELTLVTPCIVIVYIIRYFFCSQIVATREYFDSTYRYYYKEYTLVFLGFKGTNK